jgi:YVTN family beta-propeller protein
MNQKQFWTIGLIAAILAGAFLFFANIEKSATAPTIIENYQNVNAGQLKAMMQNKDFALINVHIPYEGEIEGTDIFIPYNQIDAIDFQKDQKIVLYCRSGSMSRFAAERLAELGYTNVYNLEKGMNEWEAQGYRLLVKQPMREGTEQENTIGESLPDQPLKPYDPAASAYFALGPSGLVKVVDYRSHAVVDILPGNNNPHGIAVTPDGRYVFTTSTKMGPTEMKMEPDHEGAKMDMTMMRKLGSDMVAVIDVEERKVIKKIDVGGGTHHMAITPEGKYVLTTVPSKSGIAFIDVETLVVSAFVVTGDVPNYVIVSPDNKRAYVTNKGEDTLAMIDLQSKKVGKKIGTGVRPDHIALSPDGGTIYVTNAGSDDVTIIRADTLTVRSTVSVGEAPHGIATSPNGDKVYVANSEGKSVTVISAGDYNLTSTIEVGQEVEHLEITPDGRFAYANSEEEGEVHIVDTRTDRLIGSIHIGAEPHQIAFP